MTIPIMRSGVDQPNPARKEHRMRFSMRWALVACVLSCALADADANSVQAADWFKSLSVTGAAQQSEAAWPQPCGRPSIFACRPESRCCQPDPVCAPQLCRPYPTCCQKDVVCAPILCRPEPRFCYPGPVCNDPEPRCLADCATACQPSFKTERTVPTPGGGRN